MSISLLWTIIYQRRIRSSGERYCYLWGNLQDGGQEECVFCAQSWAWGQEPQGADCISCTACCCGERGGRPSRTGYFCLVFPIPPPPPVPLLHWVIPICMISAIDKKKYLIFLVRYRLVVLRIKEIEIANFCFSELKKRVSFCPFRKNVSIQEKLALSASNNSRKLSIWFGMVGRIQLLCLLRIVCEYVLFCSRTSLKYTCKT